MPKIHFFNVTFSVYMQKTQNLAKCYIYRKMPKISFFACKLFFCIYCDKKMGQSSQTNPF